MKPGTQTFLGCLSIDIVCAKKKAETECHKVTGWHKGENYNNKTDDAFIIYAV